MAEEKVDTSGFDEKTIKNAEFCRYKCPVCVKGREKGKGFLFWIMKLEAGICPKCKAYKKVYGVPHWEKVPEEA